jgi:hypothetical protein
MNLLNKLSAFHAAYQQKLINDLLKRRAEEQHRPRVLKLFPKTNEPQPTPATAPVEDTRAKQILKDMEEFNMHHSDFVRGLGEKHT